MDTWAKESVNGGSSGITQVTTLASNSGLQGNGTVLNPLQFCADELPETPSATGDKIVVSSTARPCGELRDISQIKSFELLADTGNDTINLGDTLAIVGNTNTKIKTEVTAPNTVEVSIDTTGATLGQVLTVDGSGDIVFSTPSAISDAVDVNYDNTTSGLTATNVQDAIDELVANPGVTSINGLTGAITLTPGTNVNFAGSVGNTIQINATGSGATNLSTANNTSTTLDVLSDTGTDITLQSATTTLAGLMSATDKLKLDRVADINVPDTALSYPCTPLTLAFRSLGTGCSGYSESNYTSTITHSSIPAPTITAPAGYKWVADINVWYAIEYMDIIAPFNILNEVFVNGGFVGVYGGAVFPVKPQQTTLYVQYTIIGAEINQTASSPFTSTLVHAFSNSVTPATAFTQAVVTQQRRRLAYRLQKI